MSTTELSDIHTVLKPVETRCRFGEENLHYINTEYILECVRAGEPGIVEIVKAIWLNIDHPENWTILPNKQSRSEVFIYNKPEWHYADARNTIKDVQQKVYKLLKDVYTKSPLANNITSAIVLERHQQILWFLQSNLFYSLRPSKQFNEMNKRIYMIFYNFRPKLLMAEAKMKLEQL